ncbi:MAG: YndJ family transporter [Myxococcota bacterium]
MTESKQHPLVTMANLGLLVWVLVRFVPWPEADILDWIFLSCPLVFVPLGLAHGGLDLNRPRRVQLAQGIGSLGLALSYYVETPWSAILAGSWLIASSMFALHAVERLALHNRRPLPELCFDVGLLYLAVGALFALAGSLKTSFLGLSPKTIKTITAHLHFAGFATPFVAGLIGRCLVERPAPPATHSLYRKVVPLVLLTPALLVATAMMPPLAKTLAAITASAGLLGMALLILGPVPSRVQGWGARTLVGISGASLLSSMAIACVGAYEAHLGFHSLEPSALGSSVSDPQMLTPEVLDPAGARALLLSKLHACTAAWGFVGSALVGFTLKSEPAFKPPDTKLY